MKQSFFLRVNTVLILYRYLRTGNVTGFGIKALHPSGIKLVKNCRKLLFYRNFSAADPFLSCMNMQCAAQNDCFSDAFCRTNMRMAHFFIPLISPACRSIFHLHFEYSTIPPKRIKVNGYFSRLSCKMINFIESFFIY